jgi:hypothetical protein
LIALCAITGFISVMFILLNLLVAQFPDFEFPVNRIILFGRYGFKGVALILVALLGIPIRLGPL